MIGGIALIASIVIAQAVAFPAVSFYPIRIVGGTVAGANEFPYQISLRYQNRHICGGSIVSPTAILTASHCIISTRASQFSVKAGATHQTAAESTNQIRTASSVIKHSSYNAAKTTNDIAVITVASPFTFDASVNAIALPVAGTEVGAGTILRATGWGTTSESGTSSPLLLKVDLPAVSQATCRATYGTSAILDSMLCAGGELGKDTCQGDSGGPLVSTSGTRTLMGITSFGAGCARAGNPGVYTKVSAFRPWISTNAGV